MAHGTGQARRGRTERGDPAPGARGRHGRRRHDVAVRARLARPAWTAPARARSTASRRSWPRRRWRWRSQPRPRWPHPARRTSSRPISSAAACAERAGPWGQIVTLSSRGLTPGFARGAVSREDRGQTPLQESDDSSTPRPGLFRVRRTTRSDSTFRTRRSRVRTGYETTFSFDERASGRPRTRARRDGRGADRRGVRARRDLVPVPHGDRPHVPPLPEAGSDQPAALRCAPGSRRSGAAASSCGGELWDVGRALAEARLAFVHVPLEHFLDTPEGREHAAAWRKRLRLSNHRPE